MTKKSLNTGSKSAGKCNFYFNNTNNTDLKQDDFYFSMGDTIHFINVTGILVFALDFNSKTVSFYRKKK